MVRARAAWGLGPACQARSQHMHRARCAGTCSAPRWACTTSGCWAARACSARALSKVGRTLCPHPLPAPTLLSCTTPHALCTAPPCSAAADVGAPVCGADGAGQGSVLHEARAAAHACMRTHAHTAHARTTQPAFESTVAPGAGGAQYWAARPARAAPCTHALPPPAARPPTVWWVHAPCRVVERTSKGPMTWRDYWRGGALRRTRAACALHAHMRPGLKRPRWHAPPPAMRAPCCTMPAWCPRPCRAHAALHQPAFIGTRAACTHCSMCASRLTHAPPPPDLLQSSPMASPRAWTLASPTNH